MENLIHNRFEKLNLNELKILIDLLPFYKCNRCETTNNLFNELTKEFEKKERDVYWKQINALLEQKKIYLDSIKLIENELKKLNYE